MQRLLDVRARAERTRNRLAGGADAFRWQMRLAARNGHCEGRALTWSTRHAHRTPVQKCQFVHQCKPDTCSFMGPTGGPFDAIETFEQARHFRRWYACARIADRQLRRVVGELEIDGDFSSEGELECVGEQIQDDLLPHVMVDVDLLGQRWAVDDEAQPGAVTRGAKVA